jgi:hypothetical protein
MSSTDFSTSKIGVAKTLSSPVDLSMHFGDSFSAPPGLEPIDLLRIQRVVELNLLLGPIWMIRDEGRNPAYSVVCLLLETRSQWPFVAGGKRSET